MSYKITSPSGVFGIDGSARSYVKDFLTKTMASGFEAGVSAALGDFPNKYTVVDLSMLTIEHCVGDYATADVHFIDKIDTPGIIEGGKFYSDQVPLDNGVYAANLHFPVDVPPDGVITVLFSSGADCRLVVGQYIVTNPNTGHAWGVKLGASCYKRLCVIANGVASVYGYYGVRCPVPTALSVVAAKNSVALDTGLLLLPALPRRVKAYMPHSSYTCVSDVPSSVYLVLHLYGAVFTVGNVLVDARDGVVHFCAPVAVVKKLMACLPEPGWCGYWRDADDIAGEFVDIEWKRASLVGLASIL